MEEDRTFSGAGTGWNLTAGGSRRPSEGHKSLEEGRRSTLSMRGQAIRAQAQKEKHPFRSLLPPHETSRQPTTAHALTTLLLIPASSSFNAYDTGLQHTRSLESAPVLPSSSAPLIEFSQILTPSSSLFFPLDTSRSRLGLEQRRPASTWLKLAEKVEEMLTGTHHRRTSAASSAIPPGRDSDLHRISVRVDAPLRPVFCPFSRAQGMLTIVQYK